MMRSTYTILLVLLAIVATIGPAVYEGQRNFRWGIDPDLKKYAQRMDAFPDQIGAWKLVGELVVDAETRNQLEPFGTIARIYSDGTRTANVFVLFGPIGPTAVHTPDICFSSIDYSVLKDRIVVPAADKRTKLGSQFWQIDFQSRGLNSQVLRNWYAWTSNGKWRASQNPRYEFADQRTLFKLQVAIVYPSLEELKADKSGTDFVEQVEQRLRTTLFASNDSSIVD